MTQSQGLTHLFPLRVVSHNSGIFPIVKENRAVGSHPGDTPACRQAALQIGSSRLLHAAGNVCGGLGQLRLQPILEIAVQHAHYQYQAN